MGNDSVFGLGGDDLLIVGSGADVLNGASGNDTASYEGSGGVVASLTAPGSNTGDAAGDTYNSIENLIGTSDNDTLVGDSGANSLFGQFYGGYDILQGMAGNDILLPEPMAARWMAGPAATRRADTGPASASHGT